MTSNENEFLELHDIISNVGLDIAGEPIVFRHQHLNATLFISMDPFVATEGQRQIIRKLMGIE